MKDQWQVVFYANVPVWQYGRHITMLPAPDGMQPVPTIMCSAVQQIQNGFMELTLTEAAVAELTLLVRVEHVMCAMRLKEQQTLGFSPPSLAQAWPGEIPSKPT